MTINSKTIDLAIAAVADNCLSGDMREFLDVDPAKVTKSFDPDEPAPSTFPSTLVLFSNPLSVKSIISFLPLCRTTALSPHILTMLSENVPS